ASARAYDHLSACTCPDGGRSGAGAGNPSARRHNGSDPDGLRPGHSRGPRYGSGFESGQESSRSRGRRTGKTRMIERYTLPEMAKLWSLETKFQKWLEVEIAVCEVHAEEGVIPTEALEQIKTKAAF